MNFHLVLDCPRVAPNAQTAIGLVPPVRAPADIVRVRYGIGAVVFRLNFRRMCDQPDVHPMGPCESTNLAKALTDILGLRDVDRPSMFKFIPGINNQSPNAISGDECLGGLQQGLDRDGLLRSDEHEVALQPLEAVTDLIETHAVRFLLAKGPFYNFL